jgi:hypothetical protein
MSTTYIVGSVRSKKEVESISAIIRRLTEFSVQGIAVREARRVRF